MAGDDIVDIKFTNDQITGGAGTINVSGTVEVDYTKLTASGTLVATGSVNETYNVQFLDSVGNQEYFIQLTAPATGDPGQIQYNSQTPSQVDLNLNSGRNYSYGAVSVTSTMVCFSAGTLIETKDGLLAVEELQVGEALRTAGGRHRQIKWLGHRTIDCRSHPFPHDVMPVRIAAHALGQNLPARDLYLSPGHPVLVGADEDGEGGHLVPIMCLINGTSIARVTVDEVTYWHVELDAHDILLAEGLPAESYIDLGSRPWFAGANEALYDPDMSLPGMPGRCRPVAIDGPVVDAERRRIDALFATQLASACAWPSATPHDACGRAART